MRYVYPAIFQPNNDGSITVAFPDLPGCVTEGKDIANAMVMARDALALYLDTCDELNDPFPSASNASDVHAKQGGYVTLIDTDTAVYRRQRENQAVKRTLSLPRWLDAMASDAHISLSKVLQEALCEKLGVSTK